MVYTHKNICVFLGGDAFPSPEMEDGDCACPSCLEDGPSRAVLLTRCKNLLVVPGLLA
jgi:hypothetical protein